MSLVVHPLRFADQVHAPTSVTSECLGVACPVRISVRLLVERAIALGKTLFVETGIPQLLQWKLSSGAMR